MKSHSSVFPEVQRGKDVIDRVRRDFKTYGGPREVDRNNWVYALKYIEWLDDKDDK